MRDGELETFKVADAGAYLELKGKISLLVGVNGHEINLLSLGERRVGSYFFEERRELPAWWTPTLKIRTKGMRHE